MQKYGFTFKTVTIDEIKICLFSPKIFSIFLILIMLFKILSSTVVCIYMQSMHGLVCVCSMGTAGKEVVLAGITWFSKCQGFDVVPQCSAAEVLQGSLEPTLRGRTETKLPVYPHKPAEVSHSRPVCSSHTP